MCGSTLTASRERGAVVAGSAAMNDAIEVRTALLGMGWKWAAALPTDAAILARVYSGIRAAYLAMPESVNVDGGTRKQRRYSTAAAFDDAVTACVPATAW